MQDKESSNTLPAPLKFYRGVIIDNKDPQKIGRVRVKIFGLNDNEPDDNLPWADVIQPANTGLIGGVGYSNVLKQGTWVYVIFEDGNSNKQLVIGVATGITEYRTDGYNDPDGEFPPFSTLGMSDFGHCNINDFSLNNDALTDTTVSKHGTMFNYENTVSEDKYTSMSVLRTESGIMIELDDSDKRIKVTHPTGTTIEIKSDGTIVTTALNKVKMNVKSDVEWDIVGDWKMNVDGDVKWDIEGNWNVHDNKNINFIAEKDITFKSDNEDHITSNNFSKDIGGSWYSTVKDNLVFSSKNLSIHTNGGTMRGANVITDSKIDLNKHIHKHGSSFSQKPIPS